MGERPILFNTPMVRALLDGRKTQTRRVIKPQPVVHPAGNWSWDGRNGGFVGAAGTHLAEGFPEVARLWTRIQPGDRLWVREAWRTYSTLDDAPAREIGGMRLWYCADDGYQPKSRVRSPIHMPRVASRLTLTVTDVRVQRLQDISEEDAIAEGVECDSDGWRDYLMPETQCCASATGSYRTLWGSINGDGSWAANPWVAVYGFSDHRCNIDQMEAA